jgi:LysM repeat protein
MGAGVDDAAALEKVTALFKTEKGKRWDEWEVLEMNVQERLGQPTLGQLVIAAPSRGFDFSPILGKSCVLLLSRGRDRKRYFKGLVFRIEHRGEYPFGSVARVEFATAIRAMQHGQDSRIFENRTAPQILEEVFREALEPLGREIRLNLSRSYAVREYCVQYKESDWDFVQRLMADEGITFYLDESGNEADPETVVLVDSNEAFPEIETMGSDDEEAPPPLASTPEPSWFELEVVWDDTGQPVSGLSLEIQPRDGDGASRRTCTTDSDGRVRVKTAPTSSDVYSSLKSFSASQCAAFAGAGDRSGAPPGQADGVLPAQRPCPKTIVLVESRKVRTGETLASIADELGLTSEDLALFNFGTKDPEEVNEHLKISVGCTRTGPDGKSYVFDDHDSPGQILVPRQWRMNALAPERPHVLRIKPLLFRYGLCLDKDERRLAGKLFRILENGKLLHSGETDVEGWIWAPLSSRESHDVDFSNHGLRP